MKKRLFRHATHVIFALAVAPVLVNVACGGGVANDDAIAADAGGVLDATNDGSERAYADAGPVIVDAGPDAVCPSHWEVYGATDPSDNLGHVDPRLIASGECHGSFEQFSDGGYGPTDLTLTMTQSAAGSGMFITQVAQTMPFALKRTVCLQSSGPNTGAAGYPDDGGLMCLTDVPEDRIPWDPNVVTFTNLEDMDSGLFVSLDQSTEAGVSVSNGWCRFVKN